MENATGRPAARAVHFANRVKTDALLEFIQEMSVLKFGPLWREGKLQFHTDPGESEAYRPWPIKPGQRS